MQELQQHLNTVIADDIVKLLKPWIVNKQEWYKSLSLTNKLNFSENFDKMVERITIIRLNSTTIEIGLTLQNGRRHSNFYRMMKRSFEKFFKTKIEKFIKDTYYLDTVVKDYHNHNANPEMAYPNHKELELTKSVTEFKIN